MPRGIHLLKLALLVLSILLFASSLRFDAYYTDGHRNGAPAFLSLLTGWMCLLQGGFSWLANPLLLMAWLGLLSKRDSLAAPYAGAGVLIASTFLLQSSILVDEAGHEGRISGIGVGYWLWLLSGVVALASACWPPMRKVKNSSSPRSTP